jgi:hypothetical protein
VKYGSCAGVDRGAVAGQAFEDLLSALGPHEGTRVLVPGGGPGGDVGRQVFDIAVRRALQLHGGERREPPLDEVHPRAIGRGEVEVEAPVAQQPFVDERGLVGLKIVEDHVHVELMGNLAVDRVQEGDEVRTAMGRLDVGDDTPGSVVEGGEEITGTVALVGVRGSRRCGGQRGQGRGGAVERLDLGLLVDGEMAAATGGLM